MKPLFRRIEDRAPGTPSGDPVGSLVHVAIDHGRELACERIALAIDGCAALPHLGERVPERRQRFDDGERERVGRPRPGVRQGLGEGVREQLVEHAARETEHEVGARSEPLRESMAQPPLHAAAPDDDRDGRHRIGRRERSCALRQHVGEQLDAVALVDEQAALHRPMAYTSAPRGGDYGRAVVCTVRCSSFPA